MLENLIEILMKMKLVLNKIPLSWFTDISTIVPHHHHHHFVLWKVHENIFCSKYPLKAHFRTFLIREGVQKNTFSEALSLCKDSRVKLVLLSYQILHPTLHLTWSTLCLLWSSSQLWSTWPVTMEAEQGPGVQAGLPQVRTVFSNALLYCKYYQTWKPEDGRYLICSDWPCCQLCCYGRGWSFPRISSCCGGELVFHPGNHTGHRTPSPSPSNAPIRCIWITNGMMILGPNKSWNCWNWNRQQVFYLSWTSITRTGESGEILLYVDHLQLLIHKRRSRRSVEVFHLLGQGRQDEVVPKSQPQGTRRGLQGLPLPLPPLGLLQQVWSKGQVQVQHTQLQKRGDQGHGKSKGIQVFLG